MTRQRIGALVVMGAVAVVVVAVGSWPDMVAAQVFENPLGSNDLEIENILVKIINWMLGLVAVLAMAALVWGAIRMTMSLGNEQSVQKAKQIILWAVAGLVVAMLAFFIIAEVQRFLGVG